jgi:hypothetical protein
MAARLRKEGLSQCVYAKGRAVAKTANRSGKMAQTVIGLIVLAVLAGVATGVYFKQLHYDASIYTPAELTTPDAMTAASGFVYSVPDGLEPMTAAEHFGPDTLYEKINGGAELFIEAGFVKLDCQRFQLFDQPDAWLEVFAYDMGSPSNAFSVFGAQRPDGGEAIDLTAHAYHVDGRLFFCHGQYYMKVLPATQDPNLLAAAKEMARSYVDLTGIVEEEGVDPAMLFPTEGLVANSLDLRQKDVFGCEDLNDVYLARYEIDGVSVTAYISAREDADEAEALALTYIDFLAEMGAEVPYRLGLEATGVREMELYDYRYFVSYLGPFVCGVHECPDPAVARKLAYQLLDRIAEVVDE